MRLAIINCNRRKVGGAETYINAIIPELHKLGHTLSFWSEVDGPEGYQPIALPPEVPAWCAAETGEEAALTALREWKPDLIYTNSVSNPQLEKKLLGIAPALFFAHAYHGTCISGSKTFSSPTTTPCTRRFGWQCLVNYYPRRCGGLNPITMLDQYKLQTQRLDLLKSYKAIVTHSRHMQSEYIKQGFAADRVFDFLGGSTGNGHRVTECDTVSAADSLASRSVSDEGWPHNLQNASHFRLLFLGRMEHLKGGRVLLAALPAIKAGLQKPLRVTFAGEGKDRNVWEREAARLQTHHSDIEINFVGWVDEERRNSFLDDCDILVLPSLWPEPFGKAGPEAAVRGVPVVAFNVGGVSEWLEDGVNGILASGAPPTAAGLAEAVIKCLGDWHLYEQLSRGALEQADRFKIEYHVAALNQIFSAALTVQ